MIHEELDRIPERYRAVLVLCCLEGLTQHQAAQQLGWPLGTVQSRLARGRERLRARLARRGLAPSAAVLVLPVSSEVAQAALPAALANSTVRLALTIGAARALAIGVVPVAVMRLAKGAVRTMFVNKVVDDGRGRTAGGRDDRNRRGCLRLSGRQARSGCRDEPKCVTKRERTGGREFP